MNETESTSRGEIKRERVGEAIRRRKIRKVLWVALSTLVVIVLVSGISWLSIRRARNAPGAYYPSAGQEHIGLKDTPPKPYNSNPPSSGAHFGQPANWGVYEYEVDDKIFIHNLEHGGVWIAYGPTVPPKAIEDLKEVVNEFGGSKIVMAPRSANDTDVALAVWRRVLKFNLAEGVLSDEQKNQIRAFYRAFKNRGPEFVPDTMPGTDPKSVQ